MSHSSLPLRKAQSGDKVPGVSGAPEIRGKALGTLGGTSPGPGSAQPMSDSKVPTEGNDLLVLFIFGDPSAIRTVPAPNTKKTGQFSTLCSVWGRHLHTAFFKDVPIKSPESGDLTEEY